MQAEPNPKTTIQKMEENGCYAQFKIVSRKRKMHAFRELAEQPEELDYAVSLHRGS
jgi:hypothetical protein